MMMILRIGVVVVVVAPLRSRRLEEERQSISVICLRLAPNFLHLWKQQQKKLDSSLVFFHVVPFTFFGSKNDMKKLWKNTEKSKEAGSAENGGAEKVGVPVFLSSFSHFFVDELEKINKEKYCSCRRRREANPPEKKRINAKIRRWWKKRRVR